MSHQGRDEPLAGEMLDTWNLLINELSLLSNIQVPRCYYRLKQTPVSVQLHSFSNASELAFFLDVIMGRTMWKQD